jgi:hypothetical protein
MRQETINIYTFDELTDDAKEKVIEWYRENQEFFWIDESIESLKALCDLFSGVSIKDYSLSLWGYSYIKLSIDFDGEEG